MTNWSGLDGDDTLIGDSGTHEVDNINNSYEFHDEYNRGGWVCLTRSMAGARANTRSSFKKPARSVPRQTATPCWSGFHRNSTVYRDISGLDDTLIYTVSFDFSARPGVAANSNTIEVYWDGVLLDTITADARD